MELSSIDNLWLVISACLVFLMQAGFLCIEAGMTRSKHAISVGMKNLTDFAFSSIVFWIIGFGFLFGRSQGGWIGGSHFLLDYRLNLPWPASFFLFQMMFCGTAVTIISGAAAERLRFLAYILVTVLVSSLIYPIYGHWAWGGKIIGDPGWLAGMGFIDFAGSSVVHSIGGWAALAIILIIGPRTGIFSDGKITHQFSGSNLNFSMLGVLFLWIGWIGFNGGSAFAFNETVPVIIVNTILAGASGLIIAAIYGWIFLGFPKVSVVINGSLAGLVAITASAHAVSGVFAIFIGAIGAICMAISTRLLEKWRIDDVVGAVPVHVAAGIWGTLAVALFGDPAILQTGLSRFGQLQVQLVGIGLAFLIGFGATYIICRTLNRFFTFRVSVQAETRGLNIVEHQEASEGYNLMKTMKLQKLRNDLSLRVPVESYSEFGEVAIQYNDLMDSLGRSLTSIRNLGEKEEQLKKKTVELERANKELQDFAHSVAHDLNAPLSTIRGYGSILLQEHKKISDEETEKFTHSIVEGAERMNTLISEILSYATLKTKTLDFKTISLTDEIKQVLIDLTQTIQSTRASIEVDEKIPSIEANATYIRRLFQNLISNALKYREKDVPVHIRIYAKTLKEENQLVIFVQDNGIGFDQKYYEKVFEPFKRLVSASQYEGTGIGLSTCKKIVELHHGSIAVQSSKGGGSTFSITLPIERG